MTDPRFPIGRFAFDPELAAAERTDRIAVLARAPASLRAALERLLPAQLDLPYRPGGWTVRQVVHHLADSHLHGFLRCKLALTEREPPLYAYEEARWAELADARTAPVGPSLTLLEGLHQRWAILLWSLEPADFGRRVWLPRTGWATLDEIVSLYAWHVQHHVAQLASVAPEAARVAPRRRRRTSS